MSADAASAPDVSPHHVWTAPSQRGLSPDLGRAEDPQRAADLAMHFTTVRSKHTILRQDTTTATVKPSLGQTDHVLMPKPVCAHEISVFPPITPNAPHRAQQWICWFSLILSAAHHMYRGLCEKCCCNSLVCYSYSRWYRWSCMTKSSTHSHSVTAVNLVNTLANLFSILTNTNSSPLRKRRTCYLESWCVQRVPLCQKLHDKLARLL